MGPNAVAMTPAAAPAGDAGGFYRKTPNNPKAAAGGSRVDLDVPAFLRKQGGGAE